MIWNPLTILVGFFPSAARREAAACSKRWQAAAARDPRLTLDIIRMGGVLDLQPVRLVDGYPEPEPIDPQRLAYEAGRRDFAMQLLALAHLTPDDLNILMETNDAA
ncbi:MULTISPECIES: hypothetical protein [Cereibacter]|uniref:hypothetical protein n=1 Tax=Cereibacter TaxID=1653176 RepID=UPI000C6DD716|nr:MULTISPECIES: hypothetical protein [Cereibacter]RIA01343.1 hypothetical protein D1122_01385 [Cereibacter sphaeroides]